MIDESIFNENDSEVDNAPKTYQELLDKEKRKVVGKVQSDCIRLAVKVYFRELIGEQTRVFAIELSQELSEIFGREVKPCEIYNKLNVWGKAFLDDNILNENDTKGEN